MFGVAFQHGIFLTILEFSLFCPLDLLRCNQHVHCNISSIKCDDQTWNYVVQKSLPLPLIDDNSPKQLKYMQEKLIQTVAGVGSFPNPRNSSV